jgi:Tol biopolymer transport system component
MKNPPTNPEAPKTGSSHNVIGIMMKGEFTPRKLTTSELPEKWPHIFPDGSAIVFFRAGFVGLRSTGGTVPRDWDLYYIDKQGNVERRITNMKFKYCEGMSVSPDASNVVFSALLNEHPRQSYFALRMIAIEGIPTGESRFIGGRVLLHDDKNNIHPVFSHDGKHILFIAQQRRQRTFTEVIDLTMGTVLYKTELCLFNIATGEKKVLDVSNNPITEHRFLPEMGLVSYRIDDQIIQTNAFKRVE